MSGACVKIASADSSPASAQANVATRRTGMPRRAARSAFSADARRAIPIRDRLRNTDRLTVNASTIANAKIWSPVRMG